MALRFGLFGLRGFERATSRRQHYSNPLVNYSLELLKFLYILQKLVLRVLTTAEPLVVEPHTYTISFGVSENVRKSNIA